MRTVTLSVRSVEWARQWLQPGIYSTFGYTLARNYGIGGIDTTILNAEEEYAILRQQYSRIEIEKMLRVSLLFT